MELFAILFPHHDSTIAALEFAAVAKARHYNHRTKRRGIRAKGQAHIDQINRRYFG